MNRVVVLPVEPIVGDNEAVIECPQSLVAALALELSLLLTGFSDSLRLRAPLGMSIVITVGLGSAVSKALVERASTNSLFFELGRNQAEYLQAVLLRAHRDGAAEVNHIHIEGMETNDPFDLTVMFELYSEPMSAEEAIKMMDE